MKSNVRFQTLNVLYGCVLKAWFKIASWLIHGINDGDSHRHINLITYMFEVDFGVNILVFMWKGD